MIDWLIVDLHTIIPVDLRGEISHERHRVNIQQTCLQSRRKFGKEFCFPFPDLKV